MIKDDDKHEKDCIVFHFLVCSIDCSCQGCESETKLSRFESLLTVKSTAELSMGRLDQARTRM